MYALRRRRLGHAIGQGAVALIPGAILRARNADNDYLFRQESGFFYLTGWNEPDALLVVEGGRETRSTLFCAPNDKAAELWHGKRWGVDGAKKTFGFDEAFPNTPGDITERKLFDLLREKAVIYYSHEKADGAMPGITSAIERSRIESPYQATSDNIGYILGEMRLIKSPFEVDLMRRAAKISARTHREILSLVSPGMTEYELEAEIAYRFRKAGGHPHHAYPPIVASGANACTLHYNENARKIEDGDLVLIDAGCEWRCYASDITRTFPANGRFSVEQRAIYAIVLEAQKAAIALARPGISFSLLQDTAAIVIVDGLMRLGIIPKGDPVKAVGEGKHRAFYPHGIGHFLGLDVHDVGDYQVDEFFRKKRTLENGMAITVEPGIYIQPGTPDVDPAWYGIGVRIEDDILIGHSGPEVLTTNAPKEIDEIEEIMARAKGIRP